VRATSDSDRFQAWLQDAFEARLSNAETISMGPFRAVISRAGHDKPSAWVTLVDAGASDAEGKRSLAKLRSAISGQKIDIEFEYDDHAFPHAAAWFSDAGLTLVETNPLMACRPDSFKPFAAPDVALTRLSEHGKPAELEAFQKLRWTNGGEVDREVQAVEQLRKDLMTVTSVYLLAWLEWEPAGTGVSHVTRTAAEIVGVVTRNDKRRRGVASTVTSDLARRHFETGGDFIFLDAANEPATKVYERLGFIRFGSKALYR
jgi:ribosomal protein S18 acetylase RimI-like enzyme